MLVLTLEFRNTRRKSRARVAYATHTRVYRGRSLITVARLVHRKSFIPYYYIVIPVFFPVFPVVNYLFSTLRATETFHEVFFVRNKRKTRTKKKFTNIRRTRVRLERRRSISAAVGLSSVRGFPSMERKIKKKRDCITDRVRYIIILIIQYTNIHTYIFPRAFRPRRRIR